MFKTLKAETAVIFRSHIKINRISHCLEVHKYVSVLYYASFAHSITRINWELH